MFGSGHQHTPHGFVLDRRIRLSRFRCLENSIEGDCKLFLEEVGGTGPLSPPPLVFTTYLRPRPPGNAEPHFCEPSSASTSAASKDGAPAFPSAIDAAISSCRAARSSSSSSSHPPAISSGTPLPSAKSGGSPRTSRPFRTRARRGSMSVSLADP